MTSQKRLRSRLWLSSRLSLLFASFFAAINLLALFFRVTHDGRSERATTLALSLLLPHNYKHLFANTTLSKKLGSVF